VVARFTCPIGSYASFGNFSIEDPDFYANGAVGTCVLDGVDIDGMGYVGSGEVLTPTHGHDGRYFTVQDIEALGHELELSVMGGGVTSQLASLMVDEDGSPTVLPGDTIAWWSSPWSEDPQPIADALRLTIDYDVGDLMKATGWTESTATSWVSRQSMAPLGELIDGLPVALQSRPSSSLRAGNTWQLRVEREDKALFFFFVPSADAPPSAP
jgi:hypothetical protein